MSNIREVVKRKVVFAKSPKQRSDGWEGRGGTKVRLFSHILPQDRAVQLMRLHYKGANLPSSVLAVGQNTPKAVSLILV